MVSSEIPSPGLTILTNSNPIVIAITVVAMYMDIVFKPIFLNLEISFKSEIPFINDAIIRGTAINFSIFTKILPKGLIQFKTKSPPPSTIVITSPKRIPKIIPIKIFQCNANFFIYIV